MAMAKIEDVAKGILGEDSKGLDMKTVSALMESQEGKALLRQLSGEGGDALKRAAAAAADGDRGSVQRLLISLMSSREGQALARQVKEMGKKL